MLGALVAKGVVTFEFDSTPRTLGPLMDNSLGFSSVRSLAYINNK